MARPISWQSELANIHRTVSASTRSPYSREDLESLFDIAERAARQLMELMLRTKMGNIQVVEREHLLEFLNGALDAEDLSAYLAALRKDPPRVSRRKLRITLPASLVRGQLQPLSVHNIFFKRGSMELTFTTLADLASKMVLLANVMEDPNFERRFCVTEPEPEPSDEERLARKDMQRLRAEGKAMLKVSQMLDFMKKRQIAMDEDRDHDAAVLLEAIGMRREEANRAIDELGPESMNVREQALSVLAGPIPLHQGSSLSS